MQAEPATPHGLPARRNRASGAGGAGADLPSSRISADPREHRVDIQGWWGGVNEGGTPEGWDEHLRRLQAERGETPFAEGIPWEAHALELPGLSGCPDTLQLADLERVIAGVEKNLLHDWIPLGEALAAVRDSKLYRPAFKTWGDYLDRWELNRATADDYIRAAAVARDISPIELPKAHAKILFRFDTKTRRDLAPDILNLTLREAMKLLLDRFGASSTSGKRKPRHDRNEQLVLLGRALNLMHSVDIGEVAKAASDLDERARGKLEASIRRARRTLSKLIAE